MSNEAKVQSINMSHYYGKSSGSITIAAGDMSTTFALTEDEAATLQRVAVQFFNTRKLNMAEAIASADPMPALAYTKTVDADEEIPF